MPVISTFASFDSRRADFPTKLFGTGGTIGSSLELSSMSSLMSTGGDKIFVLSSLKIKGAMASSLKWLLLNFSSSRNSSFFINLVVGTWIGSSSLKSIRAAGMSGLKGKLFFALSSVLKPREGEGMWASLKISLGFGNPMGGVSNCSSFGFLGISPASDDDVTSVSSSSGSIYGARSRGEGDLDNSLSGNKMHMCQFMGINFNE